MTEMDIGPDHLMRRAGKKSNKPSVPPVGPSTTENDAVRNVTSEDENLQTLRLDEARCTTAGNGDDYKTNE